MTEEIIEGNKLIAIFCGAKPCKDWQGYDGFEHDSYYHLQWSNKYQDNLDLFSYRHSELKYDTSFDWIIPAIKKAYDLIQEAENKYPEDLPLDDPRGWRAWSYRRPNLSIDIESTWKSLVRFIQWYNDTKN